MNNKLKVAVFTTFGDWDDAYSLCGVVKHQLLSLVSHGYEPVLFVLTCFPEKALGSIPSGVEVRRVIPTISFEPYQGIAASRNVPACFEKDVAKIIPAYDEHFKDIDIFLCHDIIFQDSFLAYNAALRKFVMRKGQKFFHWMHSGASARPANMQPPIEYLYTLPPQSKLIYMNAYDTVAAAEMYGVWPKDVRVVHNPIDYRSLPNVHPLVKQLIDNYRLNDADVIGIYPLSSTRMNEGGKQVNKAIRIMAGLKKLGLNVRYIVVNAHANGEREKNQILNVLDFGTSLGLKPMEELIFTSMVDKPKYEHGCPHEVVLQLFQMSDVFLFPSVSENCPLILLEAALGKNLLVLNEDFSPIKDFVGKNAFYFHFDSVRTTTNHPIGEDNYYLDMAKIIRSELFSNKTYLANRDIRNKFNMDYVFEKELEPLFHTDV